MSRVCLAGRSAGPAAGAGDVVMRSKQNLLEADRMWSNDGAPAEEKATSRH